MDRILSKPVKLFTKYNGKIKRDIVEKDALNVFDVMETNYTSSKHKDKRSQSMKTLKKSQSHQQIKNSISRDRPSNIVEPNII